MPHQPPRYGVSSGAGVCVPVALAAHEERRLARVAVGGLHYQVVAEPGGGGVLEQLGIAGRTPENVRDARDARCLPELRGDDLGIEPVAKLGRWQRDLEPRLGRPALGLLIEEHEHRLAALALAAGARLPVRGDELGQPLVPEQVVADVLDRAELRVWGPGRNEHAWMAAVERVEVVDVVEPPDPPIDPEKVERDRRDEVHRRLVGPEEATQLRDPTQRRRVVGHALSSVSRRPRGGRARRRAGQV